MRWPQIFFAYTLFYSAYYGVKCYFRDWMNEWVSETNLDEGGWHQIYWEIRCLSNVRFLMQYYYSCEMLHVKFFLPPQIIYAKSQQSHTIYGDMITTLLLAHFFLLYSLVLFSWTVDGLDSTFRVVLISFQRKNTQFVLCFPVILLLSLPPNVFVLDGSDPLPGPSSSRRSLLSTRQQVHTIHMDMYPSAMGK